MRVSLRAGRHWGGISVGVAFLFVPAARVGAQQPVGVEFQVNTYGTGDQSDPGVAIDASGNFIIVWTGDGPGNPQGVFARRFTTEGAPSGPEFDVNTYAVAPASSARVAFDALGQAAVVWSHGGPPPWEIDARLLNGGGDGLGPGAHFPVGQPAESPNRSPSVASDGPDSFVVTWLQDALGGSLRQTVRGAQFGAEGPTSPEFVVAEVGASYNYFSKARVASGGLGRFVVTWDEYTQVDEDTYTEFHVRARQFYAPGVPSASAVVLGSGLSEDPAVAMSPSGRFIVAWMQDNREVRHQGFDANSVPVTPVETATQTPAWGNTDAASDAKGGYVLVWRSSPSPYEVMARRFDRQGNPMSPELVVSSAASEPRGAAVAMNGTGDFVVAWPSWNQDGDRMGIFARRFRLPDVIFSDGFESGDLAVWQTVAPAANELAVAPEAALGGTTLGLRADVDDRQSIWVQDEVPNAEDRYRARFYFDPNSFDPGEALDRHRMVVFLGLSQEPVARLITIALRRLGGQYSVRGRVRLDNDTRVNTDFVPLTDAPHLIEFDWRRASTPDANDGSFELWIDGVPASALSGLDNDLRGIDSGRMGASNVKVGAEGALFFDEFLSLRR